MDEDFYFEDEDDEFEARNVASYEEYMLSSMNAS